MSDPVSSDAMVDLVGALRSELAALQVDHPAVAAYLGEVVLGLAEKQPERLTPEAAASLCLDLLRTIENWEPTPAQAEARALEVRLQEVEQRIATLRSRTDVVDLSSGRQVLRALVRP